ncbi:PPA1309 family protein [Actinomyces vulturis]|uniref:PPA1309 family protein n=1 Tax=Actinomyces vulturis TaxID=1857645 RepID=UPI000836F4B9|nr:PPA1309 family protein [Actinomyces vulturis]
MSDSAFPSPAAFALSQALMEIDEHIAPAGWDTPVRVFALVRTAAALASDTSMAALLSDKAKDEAKNNEWSLLSIEQENLPASTDLADLLAQIAWPEEVDGMAMSTETTILPPEAQKEAAAITDPTELAQFAANHPGRDEMRVVAGVLRSGESWCVGRLRSHDDPDDLLMSRDLAPSLLEMMAQTFE